MEIQSARYNRLGAINAVIDGTEYTVPKTLNNSHYQAIAEWVDKQGGVIDPYEAPEEPVPEFVTGRQFKSQLYKDGIKDIVEEWVAEQNPLVQISYENSSNFYREEPMMAQGFHDLGFTDEQIKSFFIEASKF